MTYHSFKYTVLTVLSAFPIFYAVHRHSYITGYDDGADTVSPHDSEPLTRIDLLRSVLMSTDRYIRWIHRQRLKGI